LHPEVQDVIYHDGVRELRGTKLLSVVSVPALGRPRQEDSSLGYTLREALLEKEKKRILSLLCDGHERSFWGTDSVLYGFILQWFYSFIKLTMLQIHDTCDFLYMLYID
jgi:hypothetical protein